MLIIKDFGSVCFVHKRKRKTIKSEIVSRKFHALAVLLFLQLTASDYPFGMCKPFLHYIPSFFRLMSRMTKVHFKGNRWENCNACDVKCKHLTIDESYTRMQTSFARVEINLFVSYLTNKMNTCPQTYVTLADFGYPW